MINTLKKSIIFIFSLLIIVLLCLYYFRHSANSISYPTYFSYTPNETAELRKLNSDKVIKMDSLKKWDAILFNLIKEHALGDAPASRIYAYFYTAQRDAAYLSYNIKNNFMGTIDSISAKTLCTFFPTNCADIVANAERDQYSDKIANIVISKIKQRMALDQKNQKLSLEKISDQNWAGTRPYFGQETGSWKTWLINSGSEFQAPLPPNNDSPEWKNQLNMTKNALAAITPNETLLVVYWAGNPGTITPPGIWLKIANEYLESHSVPLPKVLLVRSVLAMGIADSVISVFNAKYSYWVKRPFMLDPTIHTIMPTPNHPSYPAGHSTISGAAATILSFYLPENSKQWWIDANEASQGRVRGGIHFPLDAQQGLILGIKVGEAAIKAGNK